MAYLTIFFKENHKTSLNQTLLVKLDNPSKKVHPSIKGHTLIYGQLRPVYFPRCFPQQCLAHILMKQYAFCNILYTVLLILNYSYSAKRKIEIILVYIISTK